MSEVKNDRVTEILFEVLEGLNKDSKKQVGRELCENAHAICEVAKSIRVRTNMQSWLGDG